MVCYHLHDVLHAWLLFVGPTYCDGLRAVLVEELGRAFAGIDGIACIREHTGAVEHGHFLLRAAAADHHTLFLARNLIARGNHAVELLEAVA